MSNNNLSKTYHCGVYLRLSKEDEDISSGTKLQSNSIENQREYIKKFLVTKPEIEIVKYFVDDGFSGIDFERPAFREMIQEIERGRVNCVIVKDLSRFGRNYIEAGKYIEEIFPRQGVRFIAINDNYDSADRNSSSNHIIVPFKNLINDAYCRDISIKVRSHLEIKRKRGEFIGAFTVYGYLKGANKNQLVVDEYASEIVKQIFQMKMSGMSQHTIADKLNCLGILSPADYKKEQGSSYQTVFQIHNRSSWTAMAVRRILTNEVYIGNLVQGKESTPNYKIKVRQKKPREEWIRVENTHQAIVAKDDFNVVQDILKKDTRIMDGDKKVALYSGYLFCADCGCSMVRKKAICGTTEYIYYICSGNKKNKDYCSGHRISEIALNKVITDVLRMHMTYLGDLKNKIRSLSSSPYASNKTALIDLQMIREKEDSEKYNRLRLECYEDYKQDLITQEEYLLFKKELEKRSEEAKRVIEELTRQKQLLLEGQLENRLWLESFLEKENVRLKRSLLIRLIDKIYIYESRRVEVIFRYQNELENVASLVEDAQNEMA